MSDEKKCCYCDEKEELRPYGPDGAWVCFPCAMLPDHIEETNRQFDKKLKAATDDAEKTGSIITLGGDDGPSAVKIHGDN